MVAKLSFTLLQTVSRRLEPSEKGVSLEAYRNEFR